MATSEENEQLMIYCLMICCVCASLIIIIIVIINFTLAAVEIGKKTGNPKSASGRNTKTTVKRATGQRVTSSNIARTYMEAEEFCTQYNKYLPYPRSQKAEDLIIKAIKKSKAAKCRYVFFAYVANVNVRYQSSINDVIWPSLKMLKDVNGAFTNSKLPLITHVARYLADYCRQHRFRCVDIYEALSNDDVPKNFLRAKREDSTLTLIPYDKNIHPENLKLRQLPQNIPFVVMATRYYFRYEFGNVEQTYKSKRFVVVDPEYDCLAYDTVRDKMVTRSCHSLSCPICY